MGVSLKLMSFTFWAFSLTFAQGQECFREDLVLENTEPLQKPSYSHGESVKVTCIIGYTGMHIYTCNKGTWDKKVKRECEKKKCGHPEDAPNSDFKLLDGHNEFVFGARVEYTCKKGYEMTSRVRQRTCRSNGWDGAVPVCEKVICPPVPTEDDVTASGNIEEGRYGDVIQFDCVSSDKMIKGKKEIHCKEYGEWSGSVPECIDIMCTPPHIQHLTGELKNMYRKDETLHYSCETGYKPRQGTPKCTKYGWSLQPECEVTCQEQELSNVQILMGHPGINPPYTSGHVLIFKCTDVNMKMYGQRAIECQSNGNWDNPYPKCKVALCPKPLQIMNNGKLIDETQDERKYSHGDTVRYECDDDYESQVEPIALCNVHTWIYPECIKKTQCNKPTKNLRFVTLSDEKKLKFNNFGILTYTCKAPYDVNPGGTLMCKNEKWNGTFDCTSRTCPMPPSVEDGFMDIKHINADGVITRVSYTCPKLFVLSKQQAFYICQDGKWETPPKCLKPCKITPLIYKDYNIQPVPDNYVRHNENDFTLECNTGWNVGGVLRSSYSNAWCTDGTLQIESKCSEQNWRGK